MLPTPLLPALCYLLSATDSLLPTLCYHLSATNSLLAALCYQLYATNLLLPTLCYQLSANSSMLPALCYQLSANSSLLPAFCYRLSATSSLLPALCYQLSATSSLLPARASVSLQSTCKDTSTRDSMQRCLGVELASCWGRIHTQSCVHASARVCDSHAVEECARRKLRWRVVHHRACVSFDDQH